MGSLTSLPALGNSKGGAGETKTQCESVLCPEQLQTPPKCHHFCHPLGPPNADGSFRDNYSPFQDSVTLRSEIPWEMGVCVSLEVSSSTCHPLASALQTAGSAWLNILLNSTWMVERVSHIDSSRETERSRQRWPQHSTVTEEHGVTHNCYQRK